MPVVGRGGQEAGCRRPPAPHNFPRAVSTGSLGDMEAGEEAQAVDTSLPEQEATASEPAAATEPEPPSSPAAGESGVAHSGPSLP